MKYNVDLDLATKNSLSLIIERIKSNSTILEFGPANGRLTRHLSTKMNCSVYCVEIDEKAAQDASLYAEKILVDSIENYNWINEFENIEFDYIIFADVLEHLYDPKEVLLQSKSVLKANGSILISVPNIAHNAIVMDLIKNKFIYRPVGLLDETHIRFFTKITLDKLVKELDLHTSYEDGVFIKPEYTELANSYDELPIEISKYLKKNTFGEVYQFIYEIGKEKVIEPENNLLDSKEYTQYTQLMYVEDQNKKIEEQRIIIEQKENYINEQRDIIKQKESFINEQKDIINEQKDIINEQKDIIEQKENYIQEQREWINNAKARLCFRILSFLKRITTNENN